MAGRHKSKVSTYRSKSGTAAVRPRYAMGIGKQPAKQKSAKKHNPY